MAAGNEFNCFTEDIAHKVHDLANDVLKALLTNTSPNVADTRVDTSETPCKVEGTSNAIEIAAGNGYTKGGNIVTVVSSSQSGGLYKLVLADRKFTASGGSWPTFRYVVLYNSSALTAGTRPVIGWWDYGPGGVTLSDGQSFNVDFNPSTGALTIEKV